MRYGSVNHLVLHRLTDLMLKDLILTVLNLLYLSFL